MWKREISRKVYMSFFKITFGVVRKTYASVLIVGFKVDCLAWGGVFLRDPSPYIREFRKKTPKTPKSYVDKRERWMNLVSPVYLFLSSAIGVAYIGWFDIHALTGIRTRDLWGSTGSLNHYTFWSALCFLEILLFCLA